MYHPSVPARTMETLLAQRLLDLPKDAPLLLMVHGYKFSPLIPRYNPHETIFARDVSNPTWKVRSWPHQMGLGDFHNKDGLAIGFAWDARSRNWFAGPSLREVYERAGNEGAHLAHVINLIAQLDPTRKVDVIAHSMGARVILSSLQHIAQTNLGRVIIMGGAEFGAVALEAMQCRVAREAKFYNITAKQNDFYDLLFEHLANRPGPADRSLGMAFPFGRSNWVNIQIDDIPSLRKLQSMGIRIAAPTKGFCHWSFYTRDGIFNLYQAILNRQPGFTPSALSVRLGPLPEVRKSRALMLPLLSMQALRAHRTVRG